MKANPILLQKKYCRVVEIFAKLTGHYIGCGTGILLLFRGLSVDQRRCFRYALYERCVSGRRIETRI